VEREFSAGGVLVKTIRGRLMVAAIRPGGKPAGVWALPKGNLDPGEKPEETAVREVFEETGVHGHLVEKLGDVKYTYTRRSGDRVFKIVSFYLLQAGRGRIGEIVEAMRVEVTEARPSTSLTTSSKPPRRSTRSSGATTRAAPATR